MRIQDFKDKLDEIISQLIDKRLYGKMYIEKDYSTLRCLTVPNYLIPQEKEFQKVA